MSKDDPSLQNIEDLLDIAIKKMQEVKDVYSGKAIIDYKGNITGYKELEYYSYCCDAPPMSEEIVENCENNTGCCQKCGDNTSFYTNEEKL